jgi:hypothetical protein
LLTMDDSDRLYSLIINAGAVVAAAAMEELREQEGADNTGVRANADDWVRGRAWVASCFNDPVQLYCESRLRRSTFDALAEWLKAHGLSGGSLVSAEEKLLIFLYICGQGNVSHHRVAHPIEPLTFAKTTPYSTFHQMSQQPDLASLSQQRAAAIYDIP